MEITGGQGIRKARQHPSRPGTVPPRTRAAGVGSGRPVAPVGGRPAYLRSHRLAREQGCRGSSGRRPPHGVADIGHRARPCSGRPVAGPSTWRRCVDHPSRRDAGHLRGAGRQRSGRAIAGVGVRRARQRRGPQGRGGDRSGRPLRSPRGGGHPSARCPHTGRSRRQFLRQPARQIPSSAAVPSG
jgi:hypothetical protein